MRIALVHDWLLTRGGAERVLLRFHALWPEAPIFTLAADTHFLERHLPHADIRESWLTHLPFIRHLLPFFAPLMPSTMESFDFSGFDVVVSSAPLFAKGVVTRTHTRHISYCYSPSRMLWDRNASYERRGIFSRLMRHGLRLWDYQAAQRPDTLVAISTAVQARIQKYYGRDSRVIHPPLLLKATHERRAGDYYLVVGRLMPHKNIGVVIEAFSKLGRPLCIVGQGPLEKRLRRNAPANITFVRDADDNTVSRLYAECRAVILPNDEDFGMTAIEAMAYGKPILALRAGGALDSVREGITGEFFDDPIPEALAEGVLRMDRGRYRPDVIQAHAATFGSDVFDRAIMSLLHD